MSRADYAHWNEEADIMWWQEEGRFEGQEEYERDMSPSDDYDDTMYGEDEEEDFTPITVFDLALYRLQLPKDTESLNGADFQKAGLAIMGGCQVCGATLAAYNACPSKAGYWRCLHGCIGNEGWESVEEANQAIFGED